MLLLLKSVYFITHSIYVLFLFLLLRSFLALRSGFPVKIAAYILLFPIAAIIIYPNDAVNVIYAAIGFFLYLLVFYKGRLIEKLSIEMILYPIIVGINFITEDMGLHLYKIILSYTSVNASDWIYSMFNSIRAFLWFLIWYFLKNRLSQATKTITVKMWAVIDGICLASFLGIISAVIFSPKNTYASYPSCIAFMITSLSSIYLISYIVQSMRESFEVQNLKLQHSYYTELEQNQNAIRKLRHDMNHHLNVIGTFIESDKKEEAREYYRNLSIKMESGSRTFCNNSIVNAILNTKYNLAVQNHIDTFFHIDLNHMLSIDDISLCSIFSNTLDNAVEAAVKIEEPSKRKLSVKARFHNGYFSYEIINTKVNQIRSKKGNYYTDKTDLKLHGFGLQNVQDIVAAYCGTIDISYTDDTFTVIILIGNHS